MPGRSDDRDGSQASAGAEGKKKIILVECPTRVPDLNALRRFLLPLLLGGEGWGEEALTGSVQNKAAVV